MGNWTWVALACAALMPTGAWAGGFWVEGHHPVARRSVRSPIARVVKQAMPAVVSITTTERPDPDEDADGPQQGVGAGFLLTPDGYLVTSAHVVDTAVSVTVTVLSPRGHPELYRARIVGMDEETDIALLKINAHRKLPVLRLGSAQDVQVADWVVAIGSPFGLERSVSVGVVSYKGRKDVTPSGRTGYFDYLQTDAAINPGNSGGPILDLQGNVVAIANAVNTSGQGIGFAVPVDLAKKVLPELRRYGEVRRAWIGISVQDLSAAEVQDLGIDGGVRVADVVPGSPASKAGLRQGDIITGVGQGQIRRASTLRWRVGSTRIGRRLTLRVRRKGRLVRVPVRLAATPPEAPPTIRATREAENNAAPTPSHG
jgi:serine protease Do